MLFLKVDLNILSYKTVHIRFFQVSLPSNKNMVLINVIRFPLKQRLAHTNFCFDANIRFQ